MLQNKSIKKITVTRLLQVFFVAILIILSIIAIGYRNFFQFAIENKIQSVADVVKAGLTAHMKMGTMGERDYFLNEISSIHDIESIKIIRGDAVAKDYGKESSYERKLDVNLRAILNEKKTHIEWKYTQNRVEAVIPYIATSKGNFDCLNCHIVKEGTVLGAINLKMKINQYQTFVFNNSYIIIAILIIFTLAVIFNMFYVVDRYISKPLLSIIDDGEIAYASQKDILSNKYESTEIQHVAQNINKFNKTVMQKEKKLEEKNRELKLLNKEIELTLKDTMFTIGQIEELRSNDTSMHTQRVTIISTLIAKEYGLNEYQVNLLETTAPLHDIGKVGISDAILNKPAKLTEDEFDNIKTHSTLGYQILKNSKHEILQTAASIAHEHHEKYDGTGYPRGLKGEEISIYARIVATVDVFDALFSERVYKEALPLNDIIIFFKEQKGKHFEPKLVDILLENIYEYEEILNEISLKK
jgi:response regulator RpfG family c-di-GMP phosphodiesterase